MEISVRLKLPSVFANGAVGPPADLQAVCLFPSKVKILRKFLTLKCDRI